MALYTTLYPGSGLHKAEMQLRCFHASTKWCNRIFFHLPTQHSVPQLVLIAGCTGAGKSTLGMTLALNHGILRCVSTDVVRQVLRGVKSDAALHRSSYSGTGDPVREWKECCEVLQTSLQGLVDDSLDRGTSLVLEGVHLIPSNDLIERWRKRGGVALGCVLVIKDPEAHQELLRRRGESHHCIVHSNSQLKSFDRIRAIQDEMIRLGHEHNWLQIEQRIELDPLETISDLLK